MLDDEYFEKVVKLADDIASCKRGNMRWMWGDALLGYAFARLDEHIGSERYTAMLIDYCDHYASDTPIVDQSDTAAPGLITYLVQKRTGAQSHKALTERVMEYIRNGPKVLDDCPDHLGKSVLGKLYPRSIWVDSMMMVTVLASLYARENEDEGLLRFVSKQLIEMSRYLKDPQEHLWYHSYWVRKGTHYPKKKIFWGRGNGWVICAIPMILENLGGREGRFEILRMLNETSEALLHYQREDGTFATVINRPGRTYRELSATSLIACGWFHGYRLGFLDERFLRGGKKAYKAVVDSLVRKGGRFHMPEISAPTIPMPLFPYLGYRMVPKGTDYSYGVAALVLASIEFDRSRRA